MISPMNA